jgi:hypothetical protein
LRTYFRGVLHIVDPPLLIPHLADLFSWVPYLWTHPCLFYTSRQHFIGFSSGDLMLQFPLFLLYFISIGI